MGDKPRKDIPVELTKELEDMDDLVPQLTGQGFLNALKRAEARENDNGAVVATEESPSIGSSGATRSLPTSIP